MITSFDQLLQSAGNLVRSRPVKLAVAVAQDPLVLEAVINAQERGMIEPLLVGDREAIKQIAKGFGHAFSDDLIFHESDDIKAAVKAVSLVHEGQADTLMKGYIHTDDFLRAILDREKGLRLSTLMSHVFIYEDPERQKLLFITDAAMNIAPDLQAKAQIILNCLFLTSLFGVDRPRVAIMSAVEVVNPKMPSSMDAAVLAKMGERNQFSVPCRIDGPLALDNAVSVRAAKHKKIESEVAGNADVLVVPNIESGNMLVKSFVYMAKGRVAGVLVGAKAPVVLTSRADTPEARLMSIACAVQMLGVNRQLKLKVGKISY